MLALYYGAIAAFSAAKLWRILTGTASGSLAWQMLWLALSGGATYGLAFLKPWGRRMAIWTASLLMVVLLALSALLVLMANRPSTGFFIACGAALQMLAIRYLSRPAVKLLFLADRTAGYF